MFIGTIDFPQEVVDGQRDGKLVVFAGAGVSMPPPSNLPSFADLAAQIGGGCNPRNSSESPDEYLGRLHNLGEGVAVHKLAAKILLNTESKPTDLHRALLRLFHKESGVRIVTTNFDNHFVTAANEHGLECPIFSGPALPLGNDFEGIVYLHGSAKISKEKLVLTDSITSVVPISQRRGRAGSCVRCF
jgi:NAD-dependent SIR2 family protein deacetylase